ncbi:AIPR family protein [Corynebacterium durum]|uniref:AIPR family protein n=1 Tax=Corynebacterium durum TaxID=61592 RepID=UPI00288A42F4|nr:AIPR family protein [Corynebacterium durum]
MAKKKMTIQERQILKRLSEDFEPHIDVSDLSSHNEENLHKHRQTRALAAMVLAANSRVAAEEACNAVTDESGDRGLDAVGVSLSGDIIYLIQSKVSGGSPSLTEIQKFISGIKLFLDADFDSLGPKVQRRSDELERVLDSRNLKCIAVYAYIGNIPPTKEAQKESDNFVDDVNSSGEIIEFRYMGMKEIFEVRNIAVAQGSIDAELDFKSWTTLNAYDSEIIGIVKASDLLDIIKEYGDRLFDRNIRKILDGSSTNQSIEKTISENPADFWYYNNGITIVVNSISIGKPSGAKTRRMRPKQNEQSFFLEGINVVNGAQTCGAILRASKSSMDELSEVYLTVRVISLSEKKENFDELVTRFTNTQNQIGGREFVSLDPWQQELRDSLRGEKVQYSFHTGDRENKNNFIDFFDLEDATRALSCMHSVSYAVRAKREIGSMWNDIKKSPYTDIFCEEYDPAIVYNAVRFWRILSKIIDDHSEEKDTRHNKILQQSKFFVCAMLFRRAKEDHFSFDDIENDPKYWMESHISGVREFLDAIIAEHEKINSGGYPQSFFKNITKIEDFSRTMQKYIDDIEW